MRVFLYSDNAEKSAKYTAHVCPAGDKDWEGYSADMPASWTERDGNRKRFEIRFTWGAAEVPDELGRYMIERGIAHKSRAMRRVKQLFDDAGNAVNELFDADGRSVNVRAE
jgi:hypothetical protein